MRRSPVAWLSCSVLQKMLHREGRRESRIAFGLLAVTSVFLLGAGYSPQTNYVLHCQGCHGADGIGGLPDEVPPLLDSIGYFLEVPGGRGFLIQVPGIAHAPISDAEIAELLNHILRKFSLEQIPSSFVPYTSEEVGAVRRSRADVMTTRANLVSTLREDRGVHMWSREKPMIAQKVR